MAFRAAVNVLLKNNWLSEGAFDTNGMVTGVCRVAQAGSVTILPNVLKNASDDV